MKTETLYLIRMNKLDKLKYNFVKRYKTIYENQDIEIDEDWLNGFLEDIKTEILK